MLRIRELEAEKPSVIRMPRKRWRNGRLTAIAERLQRDHDDCSRTRIDAFSSQSWHLKVKTQLL